MPDILAAQFDVGLQGLALLRSWPYLDATDAQEALAALRAAAIPEDRFKIDVLDEQSGYEQWAETYDTMANPLLSGEEPAVMQLVSRLPAGIAIDAACGAGRQSSLLSQLGHNVLGIDQSEAMLAKAREAVSAAAFRVGGLNALPAEDESADLVLCCLALTHCHDLRPPINELARVVRTGGHVILSDIHPLAVATGGHAFFRRADGSAAVVRNQVHWHSDYISAFSDANLAVRRCIEPDMTSELVQVLVNDGGPESLAALVGLPYALVWDCERVS
jgi:ubiquinone/menaquinone biosynthesis C-methylase UbiE